MSKETAAEIYEILMSEANNLECDSTYTDAGIDRNKLPWRARVAIRREIVRIRALAEKLKAS